MDAIINRITYTVYLPQAKCFHNRQIDVRKNRKLTLREAQIWINTYILAGAIVEHLQVIAEREIK
jgi:hypothetical protein